MAEDYMFISADDALAEPVQAEQKPYAAVGTIERPPEGMEPNPADVTPAAYEFYSQPDTEPLYATPEEITGEIATGTGIGLGRGAIFMEGALAGGQQVAQRLAPMAPVHPLAYATAVTVGSLGSGILADMTLGETFEKELFPELERESLKPYREGGKTFGGSIGGLRVMYSLPNSSLNTLTKIMGDVGEYARKNKKTFAAAETLAGGTSGYAGTVAMEKYPDSPATRLGYELGAGIMTPNAQLTGAVNWIKNKGTDLFAAFSRTAQEQRAADRLVTLVEESGENLDTLIKALTTDLPGEVIPTAAQKSRSDALTILETTLAKTHAPYALEIEEQGRSSISALRNLIKIMHASGQPVMVKHAAETRFVLFNDMLARRFATAQDRSAEALSKIKVDDPRQARAEAMTIVSKNVGDALEEARAHESVLWDRALKSTALQGAFKKRNTGAYPMITPTNLANQMLEAAASISPAKFKSLPPTIKDHFDTVGISADDIALYRQGRKSIEFLDTGVVPKEYMPEGFKDIDTEDLMQMRTDFLEAGREARKAGMGKRSNDYRISSMLAKGALDDVDRNLTGPGYDEARQFSRALNDFFTRTFAGDVAISVDKSGKTLTPEAMWQSAYSTLSDRNIAKMKQVEDAVGFLALEYDTAVKKFGKESPQALELKPMADEARKGVASIQEAHEMVLRVHADKLMKTDPVTGQPTVDPKALQKFVSENRAMIKVLGMEDTFANADRAQVALLNAQKFDSNAKNLIKQQTGLAKLIGHDSIIDGIGAALSSKNPQTELKQIAHLAKKNGLGAGLRKALDDYAFIKATDSKGNFSPKLYKDLWFDEGVSSGLGTMYQILQSEGLMTARQAGEMKKIMYPMMSVERALTNRTQVEDLLQNADAATELALRVIGARAGTSLAGEGTQSLIAASAGSKYMRKLFDKMPVTMVRQVMEEATKDPELMAALLKKGVNRKKYPKRFGSDWVKAKEADERNFTGLYGILTAKGFRLPNIMAIRNAVEEELSQEEIPTESEASGMNKPISRPQASRMLQELPTAPTRGIGQPAPQQTAQAAPAPAAPPTDQGAGQGTSREMLQRLFPMDTMLS
jgi:hypothetical protein